ncbi:MAG: hypothetical protein WCX95_01340 [Candidatus Gracilibacteria bacterium]
MIEVTPVVTKSPEPMAPRAIRPTDFQYSTPKTKAIKAADPGPLPGRGMIIKRMMKRASYLSKFLECSARVFVKSFSNKESSFFECLRRKSETGPSILRKIIDGIRLPATPKRVAVVADRPRLIPKGIPNFMSTKGIIDVKKVASSGDMVLF